MKKLVVSLLLALSLVIPLLGTPGKALALTPAVDLDVTFNSKYVWRGMLLVDDWVVQPSLNLGLGGFTFNLWGNYEPTDQTGHEKEFTELDLTLEYAFEAGKFSFPVGVIHYLFPNTSALATTELYAGVAYDWLISPSLTVYHDLDQAAGGTYLNLAAAYSYQVPGLPSGVSLGVELSASLAYATSDYLQAYFGVDKAAWSDWSLGLALPLGVLDGRLTFTPAVSYSDLVDSELRDTTPDHGNLVFGLSATMSF